MTEWSCQWIEGLWACVVKAHQNLKRINRFKAQWRQFTLLRLFHSSNDHEVFRLILGDRQSSRQSSWQFSFGLSSRKKYRSRENWGPSASTSIRNVYLCFLLSISLLHYTKHFQTLMLLPRSSHETSNINQTISISNQLFPSPSEVRTMFLTWIVFSFSSFLKKFSFMSFFSFYIVGISFFFDAGI